MKSLKEAQVTMDRAVTAVCGIYNDLRLVIEQRDEVASALQAMLDAEFMVTTDIDCHRAAVIERAETAIKCVKAAIQKEAT